VSAPEKATPRWHGADAEQNQTRTDILPDAAANCQAAADALSAHRARVAAADKAFQTWRAKFALKGFELRILSDDGAAVLMVSRWGLVREFATLAELEAFAAQVGAAL